MSFVLVTLRHYAGVSLLCVLHHVQRTAKSHAVVILPHCLHAESLIWAELKNTATILFALPSVTGASLLNEQCQPDRAAFS